MGKPELLVYDDEKNAKRRYIEKLIGIDELTKKYEIVSLKDEDFLKAVDELRDRVRESRSKEMNDEDWNHKFDEASIFVIDYDLIDIAKISENGEEVAYYLRCFSKCKYIVGLNRFGPHTFDLTLRGHLDSYADINIGSNDLSNLGLWTGERKGYCPWYWPSIIKYVKLFKKRLMDVKENYSKPICKTLGIPEDVFISLSQSAGEHLGVSRENVKKATFKNFFENSDIVLKEKDKKNRFSDEMKVRITTARISKWLERSVLPGQNILVDAPHLVLRFPSLLKGKPSKLDSWNATTKLNSIKDLGIKFNKISDFKFQENYWLSRPMWFWDKISECEDILEVQEPWKRVNYDYVFAEDASKFFMRKSCREFISDVDSPFMSRFVKLFDGVDYRPKIRLYMK